MQIIFYLQHKRPSQNQNFLAVWYDDTVFNWIYSLVAKTRFLTLWTVFCEYHWWIVFGHYRLYRETYLNVPTNQKKIVNYASSSHAVRLLLQYRLPFNEFDCNSGASRIVRCSPGLHHASSVWKLLENILFSSSILTKTCFNRYSFSHSFWRATVHGIRQNWVHLTP